jgi:protein-S-isoprenylcysteine O-methyltransferase Ste14
VAVHSPGAGVRRGGPQPRAGNVRAVRSQTAHTSGRVLLAATRIWLPLVIAAAGIILIVLGHATLSDRSSTRSLEAGAGVGLVIVAIIVWMVNWMFRMSIESNRDRDEEERAREFFDVHGYWPDEER